MVMMVMMMMGDAADALGDDDDAADSDAAADGHDDAIRAKNIISLSVISGYPMCI